MGNFNGSGTFIRTYNWTQDAANNINILPDRMDTEDNGFANGLSLCITRDGQGVPQANISWNNYKITNLALATQAGDAMSQAAGDARYLQIGGTVDSRYLLINGTNAMTANLNMGGFVINNSGVPSLSGDLTPKSYVDAVASTGSPSTSLVATSIIVNNLGGF